MGKIYTFIDFETTGLNPDNSQVIEIAAVRTDENLNVVGTYHTMVSLEDGFEINPEAQKINGITEEMLIAGMDQEEALDLLEFFTDTSVWVSQNASFELAFYDKYVGKINLLSEDHLPLNFICTRTMTKLVEPNENPSLQKTATRRGIEVKGAHRAMADVLTMIEVFKYNREHLQEEQYTDVMMKFKDRDLMFVPSFAKVIEEQ